MHYGNLKTYDIADGPGVRVSLFVSGCTNRCQGCFQPQTWDFHYGQIFTDKVEQEIIDALGNEYIQGFTVLGGEPFEPLNQEALLPLIARIKRLYPNKDIWCYTGFIYDRDLVDGGRRHTLYTDEMLSYIDVLVDGPFIQQEKDLTLLFRGSRNQRLIDLPKTLHQKKIILWEPTL